MNLLSRSIRRMIKLVMLTLLGLQAVPPAMAAVRDGDFTSRTPVSYAVLDSMRGGFQREPDGPFMSFGIERNVFDNGKLVSSTVLNIPDMKRFADHRDWNPLANHRTAKPFDNDRDWNPLAKHPDMRPPDRSDTRPAVDHASAKPFIDHADVRPVVDRPDDTFTLVQSGPGHSLPHDLSSLPPFMTVIQNSLDNRTIQSETVINATVEALTWARSLDLGNALSQANIEAIRH